MSRSRKKHAITGVTTARSEKDEKRIINRSLRRTTRRLLNSEGAEDAILPIQDDVMSKWSMAKDGKMMHEKVDKPKCKDCREKMKCLVDEDWKFGCQSWRKYQWYQKALRK